jgi:hypothetical protein
VDITKTTLLKMADGFFAEARRIRKECSTQASSPERDQLIGEAEQLEAKAARLEREAASAKDGAIGPSQLSPRSGGRAFDR